MNPTIALIIGVSVLTVLVVEALYRCVRRRKPITREGSDAYFTDYPQAEEGHRPFVPLP